MAAEVIASGPQIILVRHDDWRPFYEAQRKDLARAAGKYLFAFEHVGSTAVPGLAGKPVIDILAGASTLDDPAIAASLGELGYIQIPFRPASGDAKGPGGERLFFLKRPAETAEGVAPTRPGFNVHVVAMTHFRDDAQLVFRDQLRRRPDLVAEYARLKCDIVSRITSYVEYMPAKAAFIESVLSAAREAP